MSEGTFSPETLIGKIRKRFEKPPTISQTSLKLMDDAYRKWREESARPGEWQRRWAEYGSSGGLAIIDRTIETSWFLFFEMYDFMMNQRILTGSSMTKAEMKKKSKDYGELLEEAIRYQKKSPKDRQPVSFKGDDPYLKEQCLSLLAEHWDERLQGTPMTTEKAARRLTSFK